MDLIYKDYEHKSYKITNKGGYLRFWEILNLNKYKYHSNEISDFVVNEEDNISYFDEANILTKINENIEGYFDFNKAILDIGAHIGVYSFRSFFKYVYAFEPNKIPFTLLNVNLLMHDKLNNSQTYNVLLSDKVEEINFDGFQCEQDNQYFNQNNSQLIKTHIIDEYSLDNIGLIKIDVEGFEEKVLRGGIGTIIRNNYPPILFELWDVNENGMTEEKHNSLQKFLENLGYIINWHWGDEETHLAIHKSFYDK